MTRLLTIAVTLAAALAMGGTTTAGQANTQEAPLMEVPGNGDRDAVVYTAPPRAAYAGEPAVFAIVCRPGTVPTVVYRSATISVPVHPGVTATVDDRPLPLPERWTVVIETRTVVMLEAKLSDQTAARALIDLLSRGTKLIVSAPNSRPDVFDLSQRQKSPSDGC